jgi:hypothetical protein
MDDPRGSLMIIPIVAHFQQKSPDSSDYLGFSVIFGRREGIAKCWIRVFCWLRC